LYADKFSCQGGENSSQGRKAIVDFPGESRSFPIDKGFGLMYIYIRIPGKTELKSIHYEDIHDPEKPN